MKKIAITISILIFLYILMSTLNFIAVSHEINSNILIYSKELGWINKNHAKPKGSIILIDKYKDVEFKIKDTIVYAQFWGGRFFSNYFFLKIEKKYQILKSIPNEKKIKALFYVFKDVSEEFEETQGKIPFYFPSIFSTSFANGDLMGNLISFYCATNNLDKNKLINELNLETSCEKKRNMYFTNYYNSNWINSQQNHSINSFFAKHSKFDNEEYLISISCTKKIQTSKIY